jgi:site-specific DNA-methyltransferase (adenine-specific)
MIKINTIEIKTYDSLEYLKTIESKSIGLAIYDAPYFSTGIKEVGDKQWKTEDEYINWCLEIIKETQRVLKDNGSFYWFHNDINIMVEILYKIKHETNLILQNQIIWNKFPTHNNFSRVIKTYGDNRRYGRTFTEYIYYFTFEDETGLTTIQNDRNSYKTLRDYFWYERQKIKHLSYKEINEKIGFASNGGGVASGVLNSQKLGWIFPKEETYNKFKCLGICQRPYEELKLEHDKFRQEYESLRQANENDRYPFNQPYQEFKGTTIEQQKQIIKPFSTVWEYDRNDDIVKLHITPKPVEMIKHIIEVSSRDGDTILDIFNGSGTSSLATLEVGNRNFKGCDMNLEFNEIAENRLNTYINDNNLQDIDINIS